MSALASDSVFYSALQPNTTVTTYALPSDVQLGGSLSDEAAKSRVQQQIQLRLAEKSTLPRQNGSTKAHYAMSDFGGSSSTKYNTYSPGFSSRSSYMYSNSQTMGPRISQRQEFSSRSAAPESAQFQRMSMGAAGGGGGGAYYQEGMRMSGYTGSMRQQSRMDPDAISVHSVRNMSSANPWLVDGSDAGSLVSDRDATYTLHTRSAVNGFGGQMRQGGGTLTQQSMRQSQPRGAGVMMGGGVEGFQQQQSFKGPAYRTISRITNRNRMSMGSMSGNQMTSSASNMGGGDQVDRGFMMSSMSGSQGNLAMQNQGNLMRSMSIRSIQSVGGGADVFREDGDYAGMSGFKLMNVEMAVENLADEDPAVQVLGAAFLQHQCFHNKDAKDEVRIAKGIPALVKLFDSSNDEVLRYSTGAVRNLIYENMKNKMELIQNGGLKHLADALNNSSEPELQKNITGILWNLSAKEDLKSRVADETLNDLTKSVLIPMTIDRGKDGVDKFIESHSEEEIFINTTGCLRNLSSGNEKTRKGMRETKNLMDCLVTFMNFAFLKNIAAEKGMENTLCILRNLSYQLYSELRPAQIARLNGITKDQDEKSGTVGCFTPQSKKAQKTKAAVDGKEMGLVTRKDPQESEWLYHPKIVPLYHKALKECGINATSREATLGALQNITSGDKRWACMLSGVILDKEKMMPTLIDLLSTDRDSELRTLTGLLRNLSRNATNKRAFDSASVESLLDKLPVPRCESGLSGDVMLNILATLNHLVMNDKDCAEQVYNLNGVERLKDIKENGDSSTDKIKAAKAAATVLNNMYVYKPLRKQFLKRYKKEDFMGDPVL